MPIKDKAERKAYQKEYHCKWYAANREKRKAQIKRYWAHADAKKRAERFCFDRNKRCARAHALWLKWREKHLMTCADIPEGLCCKRCHASSALIFDEFENGDITYLCCQKRRYS